MTIISRRGIYLPSHKKETLRKPVELAGLPDRLAIPLFFYGEADNPCVPSVSEDSRVRKYETVGVFASGFHVLSPADATVREIREIGGLPYLILEPDEEQQEPSPLPALDPKTVLEDEIFERANRAAVTAGGRPLSEVLDTYKKKGVVQLWADAICDETYSTARIELLRTRGEDLVAGLQLAARAIGAQAAGILVSAFSSRGLPEGVDGLPVEKALGKYPLRDRVREKLAMTQGALLDAGALLALYEAVTLGKGCVQTLVTVNGNCVATPKNLWVACGTPVSYLFDVCGLTEEPTCFLLGDAMTGRLADRKDPVALGTDTALAFVTDKIRKRACINCGRCIERCPRMLYPTEIARALDAKEYEQLLRQNAAACTGCGVCSYVCPVGIDLTMKTKRAVRQVRRLLEEEELAKAQRMLPNAVPEEEQETVLSGFGRDDLFDPVFYEPEKETLSFFTKSLTPSKKQPVPKNKKTQKNPSSKKTNGKNPSASGKPDSKGKSGGKKTTKGAKK
ncbi:4Fe-4S dicluster-binding protein [Solibaculum intestinale]|uniref:4Fe-4S dicluster-binding protein n=1 Tax=Solibaculum intestinale TaxID=3133165 RepID=A0ABV1DXY1_9FIRM